MALTTCPECQKEVSDSATTCPHCGFDLAKMRQDEQRPKNFGRLVTLGFAAFIGIAGYNAYSQHAEKRAAKLATIAEMERRNSLTPEQRIAEDQAKAKKAAAEDARRKYKEERRAQEEEEKPFRGACLVYLKASLNDPGSFQHSETFGSRIDSNNYDIWIDGRAKNGFGALIAGRWHCKVGKHGENMIVSKIEQIRP